MFKLGLIIFLISSIFVEADDFYKGVNVNTEIIYTKSLKKEKVPFQNKKIDAEKVRTNAISIFNGIYRLIFFKQNLLNFVSEDEATKSLIDSEKLINIYIKTFKKNIKNLPHDFSESATKLTSSLEEFLIEIKENDYTEEDVDKFVEILNELLIELNLEPAPFGPQIIIPKRSITLFEEKTSLWIKSLENFSENDFHSEKDKQLLEKTTNKYWNDASKLLRFSRLDRDSKKLLAKIQSLFSKALNNRISPKDITSFKKIISKIRSRLKERRFYLPKEPIENKVFQNNNSIKSVIFQNGTRYVGTVKDGLMDGKGNLYFKGGSRYVGEFKEGYFHGEGTFHYRLGSRYKGSWEKGKKSGKGIFYSINGNRYIGNFKNNNAHGFGTLFSAKGEKYVGEFKDGKLDGLGTIYLLDGSESTGEFNNNSMNGWANFKTSDDKFYYGNLFEGEVVGEGTFFDESGSFTGNWKDIEEYEEDIKEYENKKRIKIKANESIFYLLKYPYFTNKSGTERANGYGIAKLSNILFSGANKEHDIFFTLNEEWDKFFTVDDRYVGSWKNGKFHGKGRLFSGYTKYDGSFVRGNKEGWGKLLKTTGYFDTFVYEGEWSRDHYSGIGKIYRISKEEWYKDEYLKPAYLSYRKKECKTLSYFFKSNLKKICYEGDLLDGKPHGFGSSGNKIGYWKEGEWIGETQYKEIDNTPSEFNLSLLVEIISSLETEDVIEIAASFTPLDKIQELSQSGFGYDLIRNRRLSNEEISTSRKFLLGSLLLGPLSKIGKIFKKISKKVKFLKNAEKARKANDVKTKANKILKGATKNKEFYQKRKFWEKPVNFDGNKVFQRNDLIDLELIDARGRSNLQRMEKGIAPIGPDGKSINLHHMNQKQSGAIAEVTQEFHIKNKDALHINPKSTPSGIDRKVFNKWKYRYWKKRSKNF